MPVGAGAVGLSALGDNKWKDPKENGNAEREAMEDSSGGESFEGFTTGRTDARLPLEGTRRVEESGDPGSLLWW